MTFVIHVMLEYVNCFKSDPSINSSLTFLRKTPWAKEKVIKLYLETQDKKK